MKHIVVIGGGLSGTAAANWLVGHGYSVTIVEANNRLGGRIHSQSVRDSTVEMGAGFLNKSYTNLWQFLSDNHLDSKLHRQHSRTGILRDSELYYLSPMIFSRNKPLSWRAKIQAAGQLMQCLRTWPDLDLHEPWKAAKYDNQTVSETLDAKNSSEFLEYVAQPILNGYFYWEPEHTSRAMMLIIYKAALSHGTFKLRGGLQQIPETAAKGSTVLLDHSVIEARRQNSHYQVTVSGRGKTKQLMADGIVCATTASAVPALLPGLSRTQKQFFEAIRYSSAALTTHTFRASQTKGSISLAFPRSEGTDLASATLAPKPGDKAAELATLKIYASGTSAKRLIDLSDKALDATLTDAIGSVRSEFLHGDPKPISSHIQRWPEAIPHFDVGHFQRLQAFAAGEIEDQTVPLVFAGDYLGGPFMEGAFTSGSRAAERLDERLRQ